MWSFLEILLGKLGFERKWIKSIMTCVTMVTYLVLIKGQAHGFIQSGRGIRQGDPLSSFLFIIFAESLVLVLNKAKESGGIHGVQMNSYGPAVHYLLFANVSLLLCKANVEESNKVKRCLKLNGDASGQVINFQKSSITLLTKIKEEVIRLVKSILGIDKEGEEGTYLGLHVSVV